MTITVKSELDKTNEQVLALHIELGRAMLDDDQKAVTAVSKRLAEAQGRQAQLELAVSSIGLANEHSERIAEERAAKAAQEALEKQIDEADRDLQGMRLAARRVDKALAAFDAALFDLGQQGESYVEKHANLGIDKETKNFLRNKWWNVEVLEHLKNKGEEGFRRYLTYNPNFKILTYGRGCSIEDTIPQISEVLSGKMASRAKG